MIGKCFIMCLCFVNALHLISHVLRLLFIIIIMFTSTQNFRHFKKIRVGFITSSIPTIPICTKSGHFDRHKYLLLWTVINVKFVFIANICRTTVFCCLWWHFIMFSRKKWIFVGPLYFTITREGFISFRLQL